MIAAAGERHRHQGVAVHDVQRDDAGAARAGVIGQRGFLDQAAARGEHHETLGVELAHRQHGADALALAQRQQVHDRPPAAAGTGQRQLVDLQPVHLAGVREAQQRVVAVGHEQALDEVLFLDPRRRAAAPAAVLRAVLADALRLAIALVREGHHQVLLRDQVLGGQVQAIDHDRRAPLVAVLVADFQQLAADLGQQARVAVQNVQQVGDLHRQFAVLVDDLVPFQPRQALQAHVQDGLHLAIAQVIGAIDQATAGLGRALRVHAQGAGQHLAHETGREALGGQLGAGFFRGLRAADQRDHALDIGQCDGQAFQDVQPVARLAQRKQRAPADHLAAVTDEGLEHLVQRQLARLAVDQRHHVDAEHRLQLCVLVQVIEHHLRHLAAAQFDHRPHAVLVGLVADLGDALDALFLDQLGDFFQQMRLVDLVRQLEDDQAGLAGLLVLLDLDPGAHVDLAAAGGVGLADAGGAVDAGGGREIRPRQVHHQAVEIDFRVIDHRHAGVDHLDQVVRRDVGGHAHGNAGGAVDQQVRQARRQHRRFAFLAVVIGHEIDRVHVDVGQQLAGDPRQARFGVAHGGRRVAIHRAEVALTVDQRVAQRERLRHAHQRVVDGRVAVRVVLTHHLADHARRLHVRAVPVVAGFVHGIQHAPVHRLQAVLHVRQGAPDDDAHGVIEVGALELVLDVRGNNFAGELGHAVAKLRNVGMESGAPGPPQTTLARTPPAGSDARHKSLRCAANSSTGGLPSRLATAWANARDCRRRLPELVPAYPTGAVDTTRPVPPCPVEFRPRNVTL